ncbi:mycofactocin biosynthesis peptidyl-dipeptidase MftE [Dactylosporangium sp. NPDC000244]|uniref:mycofactocin biosynthesis peptidyl-dipeptidase MftE n=1 Tax=Dactylosporangium sp. NPDC000244 TaxID=3154365 RepID=UPI00331C12EA
MSEVWVADLPWPVVRERAAAGAILAVPLGSTEQHGPHLPLSTDTDVAVALCRRLAAARDDILIAPPVPYGASDEHAGFAGTLSIGQNVLERLVTRLVRSACETFGRVLLVSAHGGNAEAVTRAVDRLRAESHDVLVHMPHWEGEPHAGRTETAMLLSLTPQRVSMADAVAGDTRPIGELMPLLRAGGVRSVSPVGVLGDPAGATSAEGSRLLDTLASSLIEEVAAWRAGWR